MPICQKAKDEAKEVMSLLHRLESVAGEYECEFMAELIQELYNTEIIKGVEMRSTMAVIEPRDTLTDVQKISSGRWEVCVKCDAIVKNLAEHQLSKKCSHGKGAKQFVKTTKSMDNRELQKKSILLVDSIIKKQLTK